jgi:hypothetical protein
MKRQFMLRLLLLRFLLLTLFLLTFNCSISNAAEKIITLDESKLYVAPDNQVQHFVQSIGLAKGQEKLDLTLTYYNGTETSPGFKWLRINSSSMSYLTEQQFGGKKELSVNVSGELAAGNNQMIIQAGGVKGSSFGWRLTTPAPMMMSISPTTPQPGGSVTITGQNFSTDSSTDVATINGQPLTCVAASPTSLVFPIPEDFKVGNGTLKLKVTGLDAGEVSLSVAAGPPVLKGLSGPWVAPNYNFDIYGGPFAPDIANDRVMVGPFQAEIVSASINKLTVTAPVGFAGNPWGVNQPIKVWCNGVMARNRLTINCYSPIGNSL